MKYTPELDDLRAIAALLFFLFHAKAPAFDAGFLGADIFFVLSGYLIKKSLIIESEQYGNPPIFSGAQK